MSEEHQLPSDSDEDDEDYVPDGADSDPVSEVESEGDIESGPEDENDENKRETRKKEKKKSKPQNSISRSNDKSAPIQKPKVQEKVKITKVFEFAGEEVKVEKEVSVDSAEARLSLSTAENSTTKPSESTSPAIKERGRGGIRRVGLGGISSVLGQIGKKAKISTLEKSKLDWDNFKKQENIEEELNTHNKGKDGYLERQDFLQRADLRQFEIEKQLRNTSRRSTR
ncbi:Craniofacial development protein 1 [Acromyrmex echinatior]|uniref:Craniofacial development protein 1 n=1 Tax=Acromyrmex echinatior TaxID=103372 RepID=F4WCK6_ACREC|nr:Craniofacial development protein 1 [Acromyrmex echinatior]